MAKVLKLRRGTTSQHSSFTGAEGECTVDTDKETIVVHDGSTAGGHPVAAEDMANVSSSDIVGRLAAGSIAHAKLASDAVDGDNIADDSINSEHYVDGSIDAAHIATDAVTQAKIADASVDEARLQISNTPTNGYVLTAQSGNTGGLTWAEQSATGGATGGGNDTIFWENGQTVTTNYTITNNTNAGTFGPVTINSGVTVTVGAGENWTVI